MKRLALMTLLGSSVLLAACGSGSDSGGDSRGRLDTDYSNLRLADPALGPLSNQHPPSDFSEYLRNGLRLMVQPYGGDSQSNGNGDFAEAPPADDSAGGGNFSQTNVHVIGVDEADRLKYDGEHLFVAESPYYTYAHFASGAEIAVDDGFSGDTELPPNQAVRIYSTQPEAVGATWMARYEFERSEENPLTLSELYTLDNEEGQAESVAALSDTGLYYYWGWDDRPNYGRHAGATRVDLLDVQSPTDPQLAWSIELEGALMNSRKIGDVMYLVTRTIPVIEGLEPYPDSQEARENNEQLISDTPIEDLLPGYSVNDGVTLPLVTEEDCYLPREIASDQGYADLVTVSAIDLRSRELVSSACINAQLSGIYMSLDSLYLGAYGGNGSEQQTGLHKFTIAQGEVEYRGTGVVPGHLNWSDPSFSMDEQDGYMRVVTSARHTWNDFDHYLHVLREPVTGDTEQLEVVAKLPNEQQPEEIGKPGEDIFAVRFLGDRAYIVTFEQMDPLYVLDLSDNENPQIVGALEIPGVSTYLHPVGDGYLVSVGEDPMSMEGGVKIELFDVRDDNNPQSLDTHMIGGQGSWSEALRDLRAFNFLSMSDDSLRFTLPVTRRENYDWVDSGLHLFEINNLTGEEAVLEPVGSMIVEQPQDNSNGWHTNSGNGRSRMHGDTVFYLHGNDIWASDWNDPENVQGPFTE